MNRYSDLPMGELIFPRQDVFYQMSMSAMKVVRESCIKPLAFGEDDLRICQREGIPVFDPVDTEGNFCNYMDFIAGMNIKEADKTIIRQPKEQDSLFRQDTIQHSYPFCWRTDTPIDFKAISTWFVNVEAIKDRMVSHNQTVHWVPTHIRDGRFGKWLEKCQRLGDKS